MSALLILVAVILFVLRAFGVGAGGTVDLGWFGLAVYAASVLVGYVIPAGRGPAS